MWEIVILYKILVLIAAIRGRVGGGNHSSLVFPLPQLGMMVLEIMHMTIWHAVPQNIWVFLPIEVTE